MSIYYFSISTVSFEAQAAMELEALAASHDGPTPTYRFAIDDGRIDAAPVIGGIADDVRSGRPPGGVALGFHHAVASMMADRAAHLAGETDNLGKVALSGGVFQNALLVGLARDRIRAEGLEVLTHRVVPPNDGGLSLGQAAVAASRAGASRAEAGRAPSTSVRAKAEPAMGEWAR